MVSEVLVYRGTTLNGGETVVGRSTISFIDDGNERCFLRPLSQSGEVKPFVEIHPESLSSYSQPFSPSVDRIKTTLAASRKEADQLGVTMDVSEDVFIDDDHLDCVWYGGTIGSLAYTEYTILVEVHGDVSICGREDDPVFSEFAYSNKADVGAWLSSDSSLKDAFSSDAEIRDATSNESLDWSNNNWVEYFVIDPDGVWHEGDVIDDSVLDAFTPIAEWVKLLERDYISKATT